MLYLVIGIGLGFMILERIIPDQKLPEVKGWWVRVIVINIFQLGIVYLGSFSWDKWFLSSSLVNLGHKVSPVTGGLVSYFVITFVFYWWHRIRHEINFLWLLCHQVHHSAQRIETITSFYKHPLEIILDSIVITLVSHAIFGIGIEGAAWVLLLTAVAEYFYHMNIKTPRWLGYIIQRPEMHRIHHQRGKHYKNFSDLPIWDILFGTFENPKESKKMCGFKPEREQKFAEMLAFKNVNDTYIPSSKKHKL